MQFEAKFNLVIQGFSNNDAFSFETPKTTRTHHQLSFRREFTAQQPQTWTSQNHVMKHVTVSEIMLLSYVNLPQHMSISALKAIA